MKGAGSNEEVRSTAISLLTETESAVVIAMETYS